MKYKLLRSSLLISAVALGVTACQTTTVENPVEIITNDAYIVNIADAAIMPSKSELQGKRTKVVVLPVRVTQSADFEAGAVREMSSQIENALIKAGVEIVDRSLVGKLGEEIIAYEATGQYSGAGIDVADIAILPAVNNVQINSAFTPAQAYSDANGATYYSNAKCNYQGAVSGNVKLYRLPELAIIDGITLNGNATNSADTGASSCPVNKVMASGLAAKAADDGIFNMIHQVQKHFTQNGYVIEYRKRGDEHLVNINLGAKNGIKPGQKIQFAAKIERYNRMTETKSIAVIPYQFQGIVSDLVEGDNAWVIVDATAETQLKFGDIARTHFEEPTMLDSFMKNLTL